MTKTALLVDDETSLTNSVRRRLGSQCDLVTANSGPEGLEAITDDGPFAVIITDMRMPSMDGLGFIEKARPLAPESVFLMLTGNQDQDTAVRALNEGRVFRFLNKPCDIGVLKCAIDDGVRQYELIRHEKELLHSTFIGSVRVLTDVIELAEPRLAGRGEAVESKMESLRNQLGVDDRWEYRLAARLSLLGLALASDDDRHVLEGASHANPQGAREVLLRASGIASRLLRDIPRLEPVSMIFSQQAEVDGRICSLRPKSPQAVVQVGSTLLQIALLWDFLARQGLQSDKIAEELPAFIPGLIPELREAISECLDYEVEGPSRELTASELREGMVAGEDICTRDGAILLRRGRRLTRTHIEKLRSLRNELKTIFVTAATADARELAARELAGCEA